MTARVTLSVEVELGWGFHDLVDGVSSALSDGRTAETAALHRLLDLCDDLEIPLSFDVVGHLCHYSCSGEHEGPHDEGWFDSDPGTNVTRDPHFYAPDLMEAIAEADVDHEICTHTYSHVLCEDITDEVLEWELQRVKEVHRESGLGEPRSFVPPRNQQPPRGILRDFGIQTVRLPLSDALGTGRTKFGTFFKMLTRVPPCAEPRQGDGLVETYCTPYVSLTAEHLPTGQRSPHPAFAIVPIRLRQQLHRRALRRSLARTIEQDSAIHYWTHLWELGNDAQFEPVASFLKHVRNRVTQGKVTVAPMATLADIINER